MNAFTFGAPKLSPFSTLRRAQHADPLRTQGAVVQSHVRDGARKVRLRPVPDEQRTRVGQFKGHPRWSAGDGQKIAVDVESGLLAFADGGDMRPVAANIALVAAHLTRRESVDPP